MYPVTDRFLTAIKQPGQRKTVIDVYQGQAKVLSDLPVIDGSLRVDRSSRNRRSGSLTVGDPSLFPRLSNSILAPYSTEIVIRSGVVYRDGSEELVPLGVFLVNDTAADEAAGLIPSINFFDRAQRVYESSTLVADGGAQYGIAGQTFSGYPASQAIEATLLYPAPGWPTNSLWGMSITPGLLDPVLPGGQFDGDTDRWQLAVDLAELMGAEVFFDVAGNAIVQPVPGITSSTTDDDVVWTVAAGEGGTLTSAEQVITREFTYNGVVVIGPAPSEDIQQIRAVAVDNNVASPTYWNGLFGKKTLRISNERITTLEQAQGIAEAKLKEVLALSKNVNFGGVANPALDVGDVIKIVYNDGTSEIHLLDSFTFPLDGGPMTGTTRTIQIAVA